MTPDELIEWSTSHTAQLLTSELTKMANTYPLGGCSSFDEYRYREGVISGIMAVIDYIDSLREEHRRRSTDA